MKIQLTFLWLLSFITICSCNNDNILKKHIVTGYAQGTYYSITYYHKSDRNLKPQFDSLFQLYDRSASNYLESSIISKVNRNEEVLLDDIFIGNYNLAKEISDITDGDFDITVRPLVEAWGFGKSEKQELTPQMIDSILQFVGYKSVSLEGGKIVKQDSRTQLDFNALAQGYSVDFIAGFLKHKGIKHYLVDVGGEVFASEMKPDSTKWNIGVEKPVDSAQYGDNVAAVIPLSNRGMATSGNYRKFYVKDGIKYTHTINPHTGFSVSQRLLSATVCAESAAKADALATSFMVMGLEKTIDFVDMYPEIDVYLIYSDTIGNYQYFATKQIQELLK